MEKQNLEQIVQDGRSEEIQHIIERMPNRFAFFVATIVLSLFVLLLFFGWFVKYPDVVTGQIVVNASNSPIKIVSNSNGKLKVMSVKSADDVFENQVIGYIENSTRPEIVFYIDSLLRMYGPNEHSILSFSKALPKNLSLGELNTQYYGLVSAVQQLDNYQNDQYYSKQIASLKSLLSEQKNSVVSAGTRLDMSKKTLEYYYKFFRRDSTLLSRKVISEAELDRSQISYLSSKDAYQNALNDLISLKQQVQQTETRIQEVGITSPEKEKDLRIALISAYNDLYDSIKAWDLKYVFRSPCSGKIQFLKFFSKDQFVQSGESIFTVIPDHEKILGQLTLPSNGVGKIKKDQEVIVKLDNYPYLEYGAITGKVKSISLVSSVLKTSQNDIDTYQVLVDFPKQLMTNYGSKLDFHAEAKGSAEIITEDRRLIERFFNNLKYIIKR